MNLSELLLRVVQGDCLGNAFLLSKGLLKGLLVAFPGVLGEEFRGSCRLDTLTVGAKYKFIFLLFFFLFVTALKML